MARRLRELVQRVRQSKKAKDREDAVGDLYALELTKRDMLDLRWAIGQSYPDDRTNGEIRGVLFDKLSNIPDPTTVAFVQRVYPVLPATPEIRESALATLSEISSEASLRALCRILIDHQPKLALDNVIYPIIASPKNAGIMFPDVLTLLSERNYRRGIYAIAAAGLAAGTVSPSALGAAGPRILTDLHAAGRSYNRTEQESAARVAAERHLVAVVTVMGAFVENAEVNRALRAAVQHENARVAFTALCACRSVSGASPEALKRFATNPATRLDLFDHLQNMGQERMFPEKWRTQASFAEGDMARWLVRHNWSAPAKIKHIETRTLKLLGKEARYYVYEYKDRHSSREWLIGISGPQPLDLKKMETAGRFTFSANSSLRDEGIDKQIERLKFKARREKDKPKRGKTKARS